MLLLTWRTNKIHLANQINRAGNNLLTDSHAITVYTLFKTGGQKPYAVQRHIPVLHRLYKPGRGTIKTIFRSSRISVLGIPTGPTRGYRPKLLWPRHTTHKVSFVEVAYVAGAWRYSGSIKTGRARGLLGTRSLSSRVSPSREFTQLSAGGRYSHTGFPQIWEAWTYLQTIYPLSSAEAPAGYPHQNKIIEKIESAEERVNIR